MNSQLGSSALPKYGLRANDMTAVCMRAREFRVGSNTGVLFAFFVNFEDWQSPDFCRFRFATLSTE